MGESADGYVSGGHEYLYPALGDPKPPTGAKVCLLTIGNVCIVGPWSDDGAFKGWAPLPKRNKVKESAYVPPKIESHQTG